MIIQFLRRRGARDARRRARDRATRDAAADGRGRWRARTRGAPSDAASDARRRVHDGVAVRVRGLVPEARPVRGDARSHQRARVRDVLGDVRGDVVDAVPDRVRDRERGEREDAAVVLGGRAQERDGGAAGRRAVGAVRARIRGAGREGGGSGRTARGGGAGERGGRRRRAYAWATAATGAFAYAFLGLARRGASGEDDGSAITMVRVVSRTAVLGICLLGVLSGFGMVHFPYTTVRIFHRAIPDAEVSGLERRLVQSVETIVERKKRIEILKHEIAREARLERDRNSKNGGGGSLFNRLAGGFRLPGLGEARGEQILAISAEIEALEMVNNTLFFDLHDVNLQRQRAKMSKTPYGRFLELCGVGMAVVCGYRLVAGFKRLIFKQTPTSDPISFALHIFLANKSIHIDPATLAQYLSLLLIAFLVINSMQNFITQLVKLFFAYGGGVTTDALVLFTTEMVGLYFLSSVLLVREQLPERYRHVVTEALGADLEFRFYAKFYELIFMASAALTAIALYAKHVTATVPADVSKPVRRA